MSKRTMNVWRLMVLVLAAGGAAMSAFQADAMAFSWYDKEIKDIVVPEKVAAAEQAYKDALTTQTQEVGYMKILQKTRQTFWGKTGRGGLKG